MKTLLLAALLSVVFTVPLLADPPATTGTSKPQYQVLLDAAKDARAQFDKNIGKMESEKARLIYVTALTDIAYRYMDIGNGRVLQEFQDGMEALNKEIVKHPAPKDSNSKAFTKLRIGKWQSPRHNYIFLSDGTLRMAPESGATNGHWHINGNQYFEDERPYTIILLDNKYLCSPMMKDMYFMK